jgi:hypothetical protein
MTFFPVIELVDRYSIACLKYDKTQANKEELDFYKQQLSDYNIIVITKEIEDLYTIHKQIWELESQLKSGKEDELPLEEIGRRAIAIRDLNNKRIKLKNQAAEKLGCTVREIKQDHLSE